MFRVIEHPVPPQVAAARIHALRCEAQRYRSSAQAFARKGQTQREKWATAQVARVESVIRVLSARIV